MKISNPCVITPRLLPGVQVGGAFISIEYGEPTPDGRQGYQYHIDLGEYSHTGTDLASGVGGGTLQAGLESLLSFLGAFAESIDSHERTGREGESTELFPAKLRGWATENSDEISMLQLELEETETPFIAE